jgi:uncharacterized membrane protein AbrB (regulator of aidB expression)
LYLGAELPEDGINDSTICNNDTRLCLYTKGAVAGVMNEQFNVPSFYLLLKLLLQTWIHQFKIHYWAIQNPHWLQQISHQQEVKI